ncbi:MAG: hypothetical protein H8F28_08135 [Fibrella sp.]|nr:hypothetical protein [Armatimonadota bacterium]
MSVFRFAFSRRTLSASVFLPGLVCAITVPVHAQTLSPRPVNIVNEKFATVSSGSQSVVRVAVPSNATDSATRDAVTKKLKATWKAQGQALSRSAQSLEKAGPMKGRQVVIPVSTIIQIEKNGVPVTRAWRTRAVGGGALTFRYTGFSQQRQRELEAQIAIYYPRIEAIYGKPAVSGEVEIVDVGTFDSSSIPQVQRLFAFGGYDVANNRILLPTFDSSITSEQALILNLVHAFHGPAVFQYDAWEQGFARAAASVITRSDTFFDNETARSIFSYLPWYDLANQPGLGNPTFFPRSQANVQLEGVFTGGKMMLTRLSMSGAAWLKAYIENPNFFRQFNEAYYAQFEPGASPSLAGNVPALKNIAAPFLSDGVEGLPFEDWYRRQYVLDTSVSVGRKLHTTVIPGPFTEDGGQSALFQVVYFRTKADGDEDLLPGRVYATYHDASGATIRLGIASEQVELEGGEGSITTQSFQSREGRITVDFNVGAESVRTYLPGGLTGDLQAVLLGANTSGRDVTVIQRASTGNRTQTARTEGAAFGVNLGTASNDLVKTEITYTDTTGATKTYRRNTGDGQAFVVLRPDQNGGDLTMISRAFASAQVPYLVSFPLSPVTTSIPDTLGLSTNDFLLSYWDSVTSSYGTVVQDPGASIGSIAPGRAYWFKAAPLDRSRAEVNLQLTGTLPVTDVDFAVPARYGWNMIGSPFTGETTDVNDILVQNQNNDSITWEEAVAQNLVAAKPYRFDRATGQFVETETINAPEWEGVFLRVLIPGTLTLILPAPDATTRKVPLRTRSVATKPTRPDWAVTIRTRQDADEKYGFFGREAASTFGVARGATDGYDNRLDREEPPVVVQSVGLLFDAPTRGVTKSTGGRYVSDFRDAGKRNNAWQFTSLAVTPGPVRLQWENLGTVPRGTNLVLTDSETGEKVTLRNRSSYTWTATNTKRSRRFAISAEPTRTTPLMLTNVQVSRLGGRAQGGTRSFGISYNVTANAEVTVELMSQNGKLLSRLGNGGRSVLQGRQSVLWNGRSQDGSALPGGSYTLRITAKPTDGDGVPVTILRPVVVLN